MVLSDLCGIQSIPESAKEKGSVSIVQLLSSMGSVERFATTAELPACLTEEQALEEALQAIRNECPVSVAEAAPSEIANATRRGAGVLMEGLAVYKGHDRDCGIIAARDDDTGLYVLIKPHGWQNYYRNLKENTNAASSS